MKKIITQNPKILGGKPIIAGTRMSVESVLELLASGMEVNEILKEYPFLKKEYIQAAIKYATKLVGKTESYTFDTAKNAVNQVAAHEIRRRR